MKAAHGEATTDSLKGNQSVRDYHIRYPLMVEQLKR